MLPTTSSPAPPSLKLQPSSDATLETWIDWFWNAFLPDWVEQAHAPSQIGFFDVLNADGAPATPDRRTVLAQARLLYTFSHLALLSDHPAYHKAACIARDAVRSFRIAPGLYCMARRADGAPTGDAEDLLTRSYDQSFVILGLSTWRKLHPAEEGDELEMCWQALEGALTDSETGLLLEHDKVGSPSSPTAPRRAQNPHMHNYEAALQAYEMTGEGAWLDRAGRMRAKGLEFFIDDASGTIREFIAPGLEQLTGRDGQYREIGHQYEWAWLLLREAELGGDPSTKQIAARLLRFADTHGSSQAGVLQGAAFDAVSAHLDWRDETFLLWPQTEAIKSHAVRADQDAYAEKARGLALLIFKTYFAGRNAFANQVDAQGQVIWNETLSRLLYHVVLGFTEGARAGLWAGPKAKHDAP